MGARAVVQGLWVGKSLSTLEQLSLSSFLYHGHDYHLYVYEDIQVPRGVVLQDANEILSRTQVFKDRVLDSFANFSDIFRYKLLLERGGYWADADTICLRPFDFPQEYVFAMERTQEGTDESTKYGPALVCGGVIKAPPGSAIMRMLYEASLEKASGPYEWWELGPPMINEAVSKFGLAQFVVPAKTFVPINWWDWEDILSDRLSTRLKLRWNLMPGVYAVHLWNSMWTRAHASKDASYPAKCLYERLKGRYLTV
ncbi:MAG: hypothetical protein E8D45_13155 [Nitrospira sp.]|nr:MAG: hypothetical protein E8D45_13155 [Nitrospira sp.]